MNPIEILLRKRSVYPCIPVGRGESKTLTRQLDVTLMESGYKLSPSLLAYLGTSDFPTAVIAANEILSAVSKLLGAHVKHNPYFPKFPREVPDTLDFWIQCLLRFYLDEDSDDLYGGHLHSYDAMLVHHQKLTLKEGAKLRVIDLGGSLETELRNLFDSLAASTVPLNPEDRILVAELFDRGVYTDSPIRIRENKAIINGLKLKKGLPIEIDTVVDVLRLACFLSDGDVTLVENTKFRSPSRKIRRALVGALDQLIARDHRKVDDVAPYKEKFKRLAEKLHPREYPQFQYASAVFDFAGGALNVETFGRRAHERIEYGRTTGNFSSAIDVLVDRPGMLLKNIDLILRSGDRASVERLMQEFRETSKSMSGRNLLNLYQHLLNRGQVRSGRVFVNRLGRGFATDESLPALSVTDIETGRTIILEELERRIPSVESLVVDWPSIEGVAVPISEKSKSEGFAVLPRGSVFSVTNTATSSLRFFIYWKERQERTDYDLSCAFYDANFQLVTQVSWTNLRDGGEDSTVIHSGDFTSAPNGATEFIDIQLSRLDPRIAFILPSINFFAGEDFASVEEAFFGFMERPSKGRGLPFEAKTVSTKFALKGTGKVCLPMAFIRNPTGTITGKWLDIYAKGHSWANCVENHKFTTVGLMKAIIEKSFLPLTDLVRLHERKAISTANIESDLSKTPITYIGLRRPVGLHPDSRIFTLESFKGLIPA